MILIDPRDGGKLKKPGVEMPSDQLVRIIRGMGVECQKEVLPYGDFSFEGNLKLGRSKIGIERKTLHDLDTCIKDSRFNEQRVGMMSREMYKRSFLIVEGEWKPHDENLLLMQGYKSEQRGTSWGYFNSLFGNRVPYAKFYNYLLSVAEAGVTVTYSRTLWHTAINVVMIYKYYQKPWYAHRSMAEIHKPNIPTLDEHPSLVRSWAADIYEVGVIFSAEAERVFKTPINLALSDEDQWKSIVGIGPTRARRIMNQIRGED